VEVCTDLEPEFNEQTLGLILSGIVSIVVLYHFGHPCLHASTVVTSDGAIAFFGSKGQGKSSMAAAFLLRGASLLTDDILPLQRSGDVIQGLPSLPIMKLWGESAEGALGLSDDLPNLYPRLQKKLLALDDRFAFAQSPSRVRAMYVLDRYDPLALGHTDVVVWRLSRRDELMTLMIQTSLRSILQPAEMAALMPLYTQLLGQAPLGVVSYPDGFEYQDMVHERILTDLRAG